MARVKFTSEFLFRASPTIVYNFLTTPDCLTRWFCDDCELSDNVYTFDWEGSEEIAYCLEDIEDSYLRWQWEDYDNEYLEFKLGQSEVTGETILEITAFCDKGEEESEKEFWRVQMGQLRHATGG